MEEGWRDSLHLPEPATVHMHPRMQERPKTTPGAHITQQIHSTGLRIRGLSSSNLSFTDTTPVTVTRAAPLPKSLEIQAFGDPHEDHASSEPIPASRSQHPGSLTDS